MKFAKMAEAIGMTEDEFFELVELFLETSAADLNILQPAIETKNIQQTVESAHSIKGSAGNLGLVEMYELAKKVEEQARRGSLEGSLEAVKAMKEIYDQIAVSMQG